MFPSLKKNYFIRLYKMWPHSLDFTLDSYYLGKLKTIAANENNYLWSTCQAQFRFIVIFFHNLTYFKLDVAFH